MTPESNLRPLSPALREKAKKELFENEETRMQAIADLRAQFKEKYPELKLEREDDLFIIRFLRARKFNMERSLEILYNYHRYTQDHPEMGVKGNEEDGRKMAFHKVAGILQCKAKNGASILYLQAASLDPDKFNGTEFQKGFGYLWDQMLEDEASQICGVVMLEDLNDFTFSKARKIQKFQADNQGGEANQYHFLQNCMPLRFKGVHLINQPWWITFFVAVAKPFMSQKLRDRFFYYGSDTQQLEKHFTLKALPKQIGGEVEFDFESTFATAAHWKSRSVVDI